MEIMTPAYLQFKDAQRLVVGLWMATVVSFAHADDRPNILLLVSEDHGPELGIYGDSFARTPVLDQLGAEGVVFERAYVTQAGCSPSRASIMTGLYPHQNGQIGLATHGFGLYHDDRMLLLPNALQEAGYRTGIVGKLHVEPEARFDFDLMLEGDSFRNRDVRLMADGAMQFLRETDTGKPFFLSVNYADAHRPYLGDFVRQADGFPENPFDPGDVDVLPQIGFADTLQLEKAANYYNSIERLDAGIGVLLERMRKSGDLDNTLIVFLSDHGSDKLRGKRTVYEGGTRIPLIINWPNRIPGGLRRTELVSTIDFLPTLLDLANHPVPDFLPGKSLTPLLEGMKADWRSYLFTEYHIHSPHNLYPQRAVLSDRYKLIHNLQHGQVNPGYIFTIDRIYDTREQFDQILMQAPIRVRNAYAIMRQSPQFELYDLHNDPYEFNNLADNPSFHDIKNYLKTVLHDWQVASGDPLLSAENLRLLEHDVHGAYMNRQYLVEDANGNLVQGEYNRVRNRSDSWNFYSQWEAFRREAGK